MGKQIVLLPVFVKVRRDDLIVLYSMLSRHYPTKQMDKLIAAFKETNQ